MLRRIIPLMFYVLAVAYSSSYALKFAVCADDRDNMTSFTSVNSRCGAENPSLILNCGDLWGSVSSTTWLNVVKGNSVTNSLLNANNYLVSRGNHETFTALKAVTPTLIRNGSETYSFTMSNCFFVCAGYDNASYIKSQVTSAAAKAVKWRFVFEHVNVYSTGSHARAGYPAVESACDSGNVAMLFNGHDHTYERTKLMRGQKVVSTPANVYNLDATPGTVYTTTGCGGAPFYSIQSGQSWAAYQLANTLEMMVIDAGTDTCKVTTKKTDGTIIDQCTFIKTTLAKKRAFDITDAPIGANNGLLVSNSGNNILTLTGSGDAGMRYSVMSISGKVIMHGTSKADGAHIDCSNLTKGIYLIKMVSQNKSVLQKVSIL